MLQKSKGIVVLLAGLCLGASPSLAHDEEDLTTQGQALSAGTLWTSKEATALPVCFAPQGSFDATLVGDLKARVIESVESSWERAANINFVGFKTCDSAFKWGVRVNYRTSGRSSSDVPRNTGNKDVTLNMHLTLDAGRNTIIHEFGHALGFEHDQVRADTPIFCHDEPGGSSATGIKRNLTAWDLESIMNYCNPYYFEPRGADLSPRDIDGAELAYGPNERHRAGRNSDGSQFGSAMDVGDLNGDGFPDLVVGAPGKEVGGKKNAGSAYVYFSSPTGAFLPIDQITQQGIGLVEEMDRFGSAVAVGNFDGVPGDEIAISAPLEIVGSQTSANSLDWDGAIMVFKVEDPTSDSARFVHWQTIHIGSQTVFPPGSGGLKNRFKGGHLLGMIMAVGDTDGDGVDELFASFSSFGRSTGVARISMKTGQAHFTDAVRKSGIHVSSFALADFDGDGRDELVKGYSAAPSELLPGKPKAGQVFVYAPNRENFLQQVAELRHPGIFAPHDRSFFGSSLATGDFDGNGRQDLAVASKGQGMGSGFERVGTVSIFTNRGGPTRLVHSQEVSQNRAHQSVPILEPELNDHFGDHLAAGDVDGDGRDDLVISSRDVVGSENQIKPGVTWVFHARHDFRRALWLDPTPLRQMENAMQFGTSIALADLDLRDGMEIIVSAPAQDAENYRWDGFFRRVSTHETSGRVYVFRTPVAPLEAWYSFDQQF